MGSMEKQGPGDTRFADSEGFESGRGRWMINKIITRLTSYSCMEEGGNIFGVLSSIERMSKP